MNTFLPAKNNVSLLFSLFRKIDYRDKENSGKRKLFGIILAYLVSNTILSLNFFSFFNERSYIILTLSSNLFLLGIIVLNEFDNLFLAVRSYDSLILLPLNSKDIFISKFISALLYLSLFVFSCMLPQIVFFYFFKHETFNTILFALTSFLFSFSSILLLVFAYMLLLNIFKGKSHILLNLFQLLFFLFVFYSSTLSSRIKRSGIPVNVKIDITGFEFIKYFPQTYYAESVYNFIYTIAGTAIMIILIAAFYYSLSANYLRLLETVMSSNKSKKPKKRINITLYGNILKKYFLKNNYETAAYGLVKNQIKNSRFLKLKFIPFALMPLMMVAVGLISGIRELLFFNPSESILFMNTELLILSPSVTMMIIMSAKLLVSNTKILDDISSDTLWIYENLSIPDKRLMINGANKFVYFNFILPILLLILLALSYAAGLFNVLMNVLFVAVSVYFVLSVGTMFDKVYPFTLESTKFNSASKLLEILFSMLLGVLIFLIQIFVFQNIIFVIIFIVVFITVSILLNRI